MTHGGWRAAIACALVLAACGGSSETVDGGIDGGAGDASVDSGPGDGGILEIGDLEGDLCAPLAAVACDRFVACGCGALLSGGVLDRDACVARWTARCTAGNGPAIAAGAVVDRAAARACLELLEAAPACEEIQTTGECDHVVGLPIALGAACTLERMPCAGALGVCRGGSCVARAREGASCASVPCAPELACIEGTCATAPAPTRGPAGSTCAATADCAQGLACEGSTCTAADACPCGNLEFCGGARTCEPRRGSGEPCEGGRDCVAELFCDDATRACTPRPTEGEPCARNVICAAGLACDGDGGTCRARPLRGEPCAFDELGPGACADGLGCVDFSCADLPTEGEPCTVDSRCAEGLACDFGAEGSICIVPRGEGEVCPSDRSCGEGLHCGTSDTCEPDLPTGSPCRVGNECSGICGPGASGGLVCLDAPAAGDPCLFDDECPIDLECRAVSPSCVPEVCRDL